MESPRAFEGNTAAGKAARWRVRCAAERVQVGLFYFRFLARALTLRCCQRGTCRSPEVLTQGQALLLVGRANGLTVDFVWRAHHLMVCEPGHHLLVFQQNRDLVCPDFEHSLGSRDFTESPVTESRIKEASVVNAELTDRRVEWFHL